MINEIECPICDRKVPASATTCPHCGADLSMASFDDLEAVAENIASVKPQKKKVESKPAPLPEMKPGSASTKAASLKEEPSRSREEELEQKGFAQPPVEKEPVEAAQLEGRKPSEEKIAEKKEEDRKGLGRLFGRKKK